MSYTTSDFHETLFNSEISGQIDPSKVVRVVAAWGECGDGNEWSGGFLLELSNGRFAYIYGWCDYTGWGCQDGATVKYFDAKPELSALPEQYQDGVEWDHEPADLNRYAQGGYEDAERFK